MVMQVLTSENFSEFVSTGKVPEFKPPEAANIETVVAAKDGPPAKTVEPPRGSDGKFTKADEGDKTTLAAKPPTGDDAEDDSDLTEVVRQKIAKKHRAQKEAEEFARQQWREKQAAETRADKLQRELEDEKAKSRPATVAKEDKPPKPEDFATVAEYTDALVDYRVAKRFADDKAQAERETAEKEKSAREADFAERIAKAKEKHTDFEEVLQSIAGTDIERVPNDVIEYMQESEFGPDLLYHLAKNPDALDRYRKLSPRRFIAELGKLEAKWETPVEPASSTATLSEVAAISSAQPAVSKAPAPIAALSSDKTAVVNKDPAKMTFQELREFERQKRQASSRH